MTINKSVALVLVCSAVLVILHSAFESSHHTVRRNMSTFQFKDTLFSDSSTIRHCITKDVIGLRPNVPVISYKKLVYQKAKENSRDRKDSFQNIFDKRIWGESKQVNFSASGNRNV